MSNIQDKDRAKLIADLKALHNQALDFIVCVENGTTKNKYRKENMEEFKKQTEELDKYISDMEKGVDGNKNLSDWCEKLGDTLLDDDNFYIEEDGFSWH